MTTTASALLDQALGLIQCSPEHRDFPRARGLLRQACELGDANASILYGNFLARGIGGDRDWPSAIGLFRALASRDPLIRRGMDLIERMGLDSEGNPRTRYVARLASERPRVVIIDQLLGPDECDHLIELSAPLSAPAMVVDPASGAFIRDPVRRAQNAVFGVGADTPFVQCIARRIAAATDTDVDQGEPLQVIRYGIGDEYRLHHDYLDHPENERVLTVLIGLSDGYIGGETEFPAIGRTFRLPKGGALQFYNVVDGAVDPSSSHAGRPVSRGTKIIASRWIRQKACVPW